MDTYEKNIANMKEGAITLLDILGWKGIWQRKSDPTQSIIDIIKDAKGMIKDKPEIYNNLKVDVKSISDTIALVTTHEDSTLTINFHALITMRMIIRSIFLGIPIRGATCYGHFSELGNIMVGPAVDEVASWYETADWIGVMLTPSALFRYQYNQYKEPLVEYEVSLKTGKIKTFCVNWPWALIDFCKGNENCLTQQFLKMGPITTDIAPKFFNTLEFYKYIASYFTESQELTQYEDGKL